MQDSDISVRASDESNNNLHSIMLWLALFRHAYFVSVRDVLRYLGPGLSLRKVLSFVIQVRGYCFGRFCLSLFRRAAFSA